MIYQQLLYEKDNLTKQILDVKQQMQSLPSGKLVCSHSGKYVKWFDSDGHNKVYIPKKNRAYATELALKRFLDVRLNALLAKFHAVDLYLRHHEAGTASVQKVLRIPGYQDLLADYFTPQDDSLALWAKESFVRSDSHLDGLTHKCVSGNLVRSKSEVLIDMLLYTHKIPFRYENPLTLDGITLYPDFTIRHPATGQFFYWEHFGLIDDVSYRESAFKKLNLYITQGIIPGIHLITTFETKETPLSTELIEHVIQCYFM